MKNPTKGSPCRIFCFTVWGSPHSLFICTVFIYVYIHKASYVQRKSSNELDRACQQRRLLTDMSIMDSDCGPPGWPLWPLSVCLLSARCCSCGIVLRRQSEQQSGSLPRLHTVTGKLACWDVASKMDAVDKDDEIGKSNPHIMSLQCATDPVGSPAQ
jgi:hypothetical protein